jgi:hypothetical protein
MEFYRNKKKSLNLILICTGIFIVLALIFAYSIGLFDGQVGTKLAAVSGIFGIILAIIIVTKLIKLTDNSPLLVLSPEGLQTKLTAVGKAAGLISWKHISDVALNKMGGDTLVTLTVNQPDQYIPVIRKKLSAMVVNGIEDANGNLPIHLTAAELDFSPQELFTVITNYRAQLPRV